MWRYNYTDEIYHHGVLGMKWGVRKARSNRPTRLEKDLSKAKKKLDNAKTDKAKLKAQKKVDLLSKANPEAYATLKKNQTKAAIKITAAVGLKTYGYIKSPRGQAKIAAGKKAVQKMIDKRYNASILDASGKVLRRYNM